MAMELNSNNNGKKIVFSAASFDKINKILSALATHLPAQLCIFADMNGYPITHQGNTRKIDISTMTALAAGTFSATAEMAKITGDAKRFKFIYQEGDVRSIYLCNVSEHYLMIVLFEKKVPLGLVRILTHQAIKKMYDLLEELKEESKKASQFLDSEFRALIGKELDKSFGLKQP